MGATETDTDRPTFELKDSGERQEFQTGSVRDTREGKGRFDLIPTLALRRLAGVYERGAKKYGDNNWQKGQPLSRYFDSAMRHMMAVREGQEDEDHLFQAVWNMVGLAWTLEEVRAGRLPEELVDLPFCFKWEEQLEPIKLDLSTIGIPAEHPNPTLGPIHRPGCRTLVSPIYRCSCPPTALTDCHSGV